MEEETAFRFEHLVQRSAHPREARKPNFMLRTALLRAMALSPAFEIASAAYMKCIAGTAESA